MVLMDESGNGPSIKWRGSRVLEIEAWEPSHVRSEWLGVTIKVRTK